MSVRRIDPDSPPASVPLPGGAVRRGLSSRIDSFVHSGSGSTVGSSGATYGPQNAAQNGCAALARDGEAIMVTDTRAQRLAAIEKRIQDGVYNTRLSIERVVDRLLDKWQIGPTRPARGHDS